MSVAPIQTAASWHDIASREPRLGWEVLGGEISQKTAPSFRHGDVEAGLSEVLRPPFHRAVGGPGGWWIVSEVDVELSPHDVVRPDLAGWRRERLPVAPEQSPVRVRPDWIAEVLSESNRARDTVKKLRIYHRVGVPHYWVLDPTARTLMVYRWTEEAYVVALVAEGIERVRPQPFDAIELDLVTIFGEPDAPTG